MNGQRHSLLYRGWPLRTTLLTNAQSPMPTHHSADARTALMATYIARHANPRAGQRTTRATPYPARSRGDADKGSGGKFGARGRTVYNADTCPMAGGGGEEERRRRHWDQFLMAARGDCAEASRETTPSAAETAAATAEEMTAEEMFVLYIHNI